MRLPLLLLLAMLSSVALGACSSFDCDTNLPATCPPPQSVAEDAGVPEQMEADCTGCLVGAQASCLEADGINKLCTCAVACTPSDEE